MPPPCSFLTVGGLDQDGRLDDVAHDASREAAKSRLDFIVFKVASTLLSCS